MQLSLPHASCPQPESNRIADATAAGLVFHQRGAEIYCGGQTGEAWRIQQGSVRLDLHTGDQTRFAGVALAGDLIGVEVLLFGIYSYSARALSEVILERWSDPEEQMSAPKLLHLVHGMERRSADSVALRSGAAETRIAQLLGLMGRGLGLGKARVRVALPTLRDIADITGLTIETVSRTLKSLRHAGRLEMVGERRTREVWVQAGDGEPALGDVLAGRDDPR
ncbi:Crp/Fnr family transcriptional regulator [Thauera sp. 27]|uniref:Crp/Fnr family transcriptional regulator n=1 Tax=Thauera sp. 27 TaxID=305700 RepID=UPI0009F9C532|nr:helix-turn-helix domain-containing protein [Thauera sp. 27]